LLEKAPRCHSRMNRYRVVRDESFSRSLSERCRHWERIEEYLQGLEWQLSINPKPMGLGHEADVYQLSPEWPRYARRLGDDQVPWRCIVEWVVDEEEKAVNLMLITPSERDDVD